MTGDGTREGTPLHATCVLVGAAGVLIRGAPGSGKSALALALLSRETPRRPVRLVADDAVTLYAAGGRLVATGAAATAGLIEVRGVGLMRRAFERRAVVRLAVDLVAGAEAARLPEADTARAELCGVAIPRMALPVGAGEAAERLLAALTAVTAAGRLPGLPEGAPAPGTRIGP